MSIPNPNNDEEYKSIFENAVEGIFQSSLDGRFIKINPAMARIFGYKSPKAMVRSVKDIGAQLNVDPSDRKKFLEALQKDGFVKEFESRQQRKDGSVIWIRANARVVRDEAGEDLYIEGFVTDISSRKDAEIALRASEEKYRALVERLPAVVFLDEPYDTDEAIYISPKIEDFLGYTPEEWMNDVSWAKIIHPEDRDRILSESKRTDETGEPFREEYRIRNKKGDYIWTTEEAALVRDDQGEPLFWQGVFLDSTDRKQAEVAIQQSEEQFRTVFQSNPIAMCITTLEDGRFVDANMAYWELSGYTPDDVLNQTGIELGFISKSGWKKLVSRLRKEKSLKYIPGKLLTKSQGEKDTLEFYELIQLQGSNHQLSMFYDVSEQKKIEGAFRESEASFRGLFDSVQEAVYIQDKDGSILDVNEGAVKMYGHPHDFFIGKTPEALSAPGKNDLMVVFNAVKKSFKGKPKQFEFWGQRKNGEIFPKDVRLYKGTYFGKDVVIALARDISEQKQAEGVLRRQVQDLSILHRASVVTSTAESEDELIKRITDLIFETLQPVNCGVELVTKSGKKYAAHPSYQGSSKEGFRKKLPLSKGVVGKVISTGKPIRLEDVSKETAYVEVTKGIRSELCVPINIQERTIGAINIESKQAGAYREDDERLLVTIAGSVATAIVQLRLFETSQRRFQKISIINEATNACARAISIDDLIEDVTRIIGESLYPDNFGVLLLNKNGDRLKPHPSYRGITKEVSYGISLSQGISGQVATTRKPLRISDVKKHKKYIGITKDMLSELCVPIMYGGSLFGVINAENRNLDAFTEDDEQLLTTIASTLATAIEKLRLFEAEQQRYRESETLRQAALALTTSLELENVLEAILIATKKVVPYDGASVILLEGDKLQVTAVQGFSKHAELLNLSFPIEDSLFTAVKNSEKPVIIENAQKDKRYKNWSGAGTVHGWMGVPLKIFNDVIGYIAFESQKENAFDENLAALTQAFANQAAAAIQNARQYELEQRHSQEAETLRKAAEAITSTLDIQEVLQSTLENLNQVVPFDSATVFLLEGDKVRMTAAKGLPGGDSAIGQLFPASNELLQETWKSNHPVILIDAQEDPRFQKWAAADHVRGWMGVPLVSRGIQIGCITIDSFTPDAYCQQDATLATTFAHQAAAAIENARLFEQGEQQIRQLTVLRDIDSAISSSFDLRVILNIIIRNAVRELKADGGAILRYNPDLQALSFYVSTGFKSSLTKPRSYMRIGEGIAGQVALQRKLISTSDLGSHLDSNKNPHLTGEKFKSYFGVPLIGKGQLTGVMEIYSRAEIFPSQEWFNFLHSLSGQAAIAIDNVQLFRNLQRSNQELSLAYDTTLEGWGRALELRDSETQGHTNRVVELTVELAQSMGIQGEELTHIKRGALLHDIGKMGIPDEILHKSSSLSESEWEIMRQHPQLAHELMYPIPYLRPALDIPYGHHERWDGSGYPNGLKGEEIPLAARIFAVIDIWDALLHDRVYREAWPEEKVMEYLRDTAGVELDPVIVEKFLNILEMKK